MWASQVALVVRNSPANAGEPRDAGSIPGLGRSPGEGPGNPLQYSCLEKPIDRGAWQVTAHGLQRVGHSWSDSLHPCRTRRSAPWSSAVHSGSAGSQEGCETAGEKAFRKVPHLPELFQHQVGNLEGRENTRVFRCVLISGFPLPAPRRLGLASAPGLKRGSVPSILFRSLCSLWKWDFQRSSWGWPCHTSRSKFSSSWKGGILWRPSQQGKYINMYIYIFKKNIYIYTQCSF